MRAYSTAASSCVHVRQLGVAARWSREALVIERLELLPGDIAGELAASGHIRPQGDTVRAKLKARWRDVVIPEKLAGRVLASEGELDIDGTPEDFAARARFDFGPPGDLARIVLAMNGTDRTAHIEKLDITQRAGKLNIRGDVEFDPHVGWNLIAQAEDFNPGAFFAQWPGRIDLHFTTRGSLEEAGPRGNLHIVALSGELRGRPLAGAGQLEFAAPSQLQGKLQLSSGRSRIAMNGAAGEAINATVDLAIASLNDWVPDTQGSLSGRFRVRGEWPKLTIEGAADGKSLAFATATDAGEEPAARIGSVHVAATVNTPLDPTGKVQIDAQKIQIAGLQFASAQVNASGNQARHRVTCRPTATRSMARQRWLAESPGLAGAASCAA